MKKLKCLIINLLLIVLFMPTVYAKDITSSSTIKIDSKEEDKIVDNDYLTYKKVKANKEIQITSKKDIYGLYIVYEEKGIKGTIMLEDLSVDIGTNAFLHEYINTSEVAITKKMIIKYESDAIISDIYVLGEGEVPSFVQKWEVTDGKVDLLVLPTHSDDEHLFFAGLIPHYLDKGAKVKVAYFTNHLNNNKARLHEQINGLYEVGLRDYPIFGIVPDKKSFTKKRASINLYKENLTEEDVTKFYVNIIREYKPLVIAGHDEYGEYSHGQHILNTYILKNAVIKANDKNYDLTSVNLYGTWDTPKLYLHLYHKNKIVMDFDKPLKKYNGMSAYEVSKRGFEKHLSQKKTWFRKWLRGEENEFTSAKEIETFSPLKYGLYRSIVGKDKKKNDMFENLYMRSDERFNEKKIKKAEKRIYSKEEKHDYEDIIKYSIYSIIIIFLLIFFHKRVFILFRK